METKQTYMYHDFTTPIAVKTVNISTTINGTVIQLGF
jgi:hypothetical protein